MRRLGTSTTSRNAFTQPSISTSCLADVFDIGSIFDPSWVDRLERIAFLRTLEARLTRPVMPNDEALDYVATQAICDFLAGEIEPLFDGVIYRSAQVTAGRNIVLFHKAARVERIKLASGTKVSATTSMSTEDGEEPWYSVTELIPHAKMGAIDTTPPDDESEMFPLYPSDQVSELDQVTLRVNTKSIKVHEIQSFSF